MRKRGTPEKQRAAVIQFPERDSSVVVPFARPAAARPPPKKHNVELERALEAALAMVRAGTCVSGVFGFLDAKGKEYVIVEGEYRRSSGALSTFGFRLQAMAADDDFA